MLPAVACRTQLSGGPCPSWLQDAGFRRGACVGTSPRGKERPSSPPEKLDVSHGHSHYERGPLEKGPGLGLLQEPGLQGRRVSSQRASGDRPGNWVPKQSGCSRSGRRNPRAWCRGAWRRESREQAQPILQSSLRARPQPSPHSVRGAERTEGRALCLGEPAGRTGVPDPRPHSLQEPSPAHLQRMPRGHP